MGEEEEGCGSGDDDKQKAFRGEEDEVWKGREAT